MTLDTCSVRSFKDSGIDVDTNAAVSRSDKTRISRPLSHLISYSLRRRRPGHCSSSPFRRRGRRRRESGTAKCILSSIILSLPVQINQRLQNKSTLGNDYEIEYTPKGPLRNRSTSGSSAGGVSRERGRRPSGRRDSCCRAGLASPGNTSGWHSHPFHGSPTVSCTQCLIVSFHNLQRP